MSVHTSTGARSVNQLTGWLTGLVFLAVGLLGFTVSGGHHAVGTQGGRLLGLFEVNLLHNVVHLAVGAALIVGAMAGARVSSAANTMVGVVYLLVGVAGLFILDSGANIIALNGMDNTLHLVAGAALLAIGRLTDRS